MKIEIEKGDTQRLWVSSDADGVHIGVEAGSLDAEDTEIAGLLCQKWQGGRVYAHATLNGGRGLVGDHYGHNKTIFDAIWLMAFGRWRLSSSAAEKAQEAINSAKAEIASR